MSEVSAVVPADHPMMVAWNAYKATDSYSNTAYWAGRGIQHVDGSLWAAFVKGYEAAHKLSSPPA